MATYLVHAEFVLYSERGNVNRRFLHLATLQNPSDQFDQVLDRGSVELEDGGERIQIGGVATCENPQDVPLVLCREKCIPERQQVDGCWCIIMLLLELFLVT